MNYYFSHEITFLVRQPKNAHINEISFNTHEYIDIWLHPQLKILTM